MKVSTLVWIIGIIAGLWLLSKIGSKVESLTTSRSEVVVGGFGAVAGCQEAVDDLREIVEFIKNPEKFTAMGARTPRGALLVGPPGTGKTLLARAVAEEAGVPFINVNGSDFVEMYVGVGAQRIRDLYSRARDANRAIVFIDEVDAVARARNSSHADLKSGSQTEHENTLIALLTEIDGFSKNSGIVTIAATNRPDVLDPALTRPGRLERRVEVPNPDRNGRENILKVHTRNKPLGSDVNIQEIAARTAGMSGADLERIANEAAIIAAKRDLDCLTHACLEEAVEYVVMGRPKVSRAVTDRDRRITAWHEAGHAVVSLCLEHVEDPVSVSILPRGSAGGVTWFGSTDNQYTTRDTAIDKLAVMLAGRAAEEIHLGGSCTQGAANDLQEATDLARTMLGRLGMADGFLQVRTSNDEDLRQAVEATLDCAHKRATSTLLSNATLLESFVDALLLKDTINKEDIARLRNYADLTPPVKVARHSPEALETALARSPKRALLFKTAQGARDVVLGRASSRIFLKRRRKA